MTIKREELDRREVDFSDVASGRRLPPVHPGEILRDEFLTPTEDVAIPCGLVTDCSDLVGVFLFRISGIQPGWEPAIPRSLWCVFSDV